MLWYLDVATVGRRRPWTCAELGCLSQPKSRRVQGGWGKNDFNNSPLGEGNRVRTLKCDMPSTDTELDFRVWSFVTQRTVGFALPFFARDSSKVHTLADQSGVGYVKHEKVQSRKN